MLALFFMYVQVEERILQINRQTSALLKKIYPFNITNSNPVLHNVGFRIQKKRGYTFFGYTLKSWLYQDLVILF